MTPEVPCPFKGVLCLPQCPNYEKNAKVLNTISDSLVDTQDMTDADAVDYTSDIIQGKNKNVRPRDVSTVKGVYKVSSGRMNKALRDQCIG